MRPWAALLFLVAGCQNQFDPASWVVGLRVLAIKAEPPEVAPGETSQLTVLAVDSSGNRVTFQWARCNEAPGPTDPAVNLHCVSGDAGPPTIAPLDGGDPKTGAIAVTMPAVSPTELGVPDYTFGFYVPFRLLADALPPPGTDAGADEIISFYRLRLATGLEARNHNPRLAGISVVAGAGVPDAGLFGAPASYPSLDDNGPPIVIRAGEKVTLRALLDISSIESFLVVDGDPRLKQFKLVEEQPRILWYATAGSFDHQVTGLNNADTTFNVDPAPPPRREWHNARPDWDDNPDAGGDARITPVTIWAVAHDERGGTDWLQRTIWVR